MTAGEVAAREPSAPVFFDLHGLTFVTEHPLYEGFCVNKVVN